MTNASGLHTSASSSACNANDMSSGTDNPVHSIEELPCHQEQSVITPQKHVVSNSTSQDDHNDLPLDHKKHSLGAKEDVYTTENPQCSIRNGVPHVDVDPIEYGRTSYHHGQDGLIELAKSKGTHGVDEYLGGQSKYLLC